jgi:hypothetical protein
MVPSEFGSRWRGKASGQSVNMVCGYCTTVVGSACEPARSPRPAGRSVCAPGCGAETRQPLERRAVDIPHRSLPRPRRRPDEPHSNQSINSCSTNESYISDMLTAGLCT